MQTKTRKRKKLSETTHIVTAGSTIRIEQPASARQPQPSKVTIVAQEINPTRGLMSFLRENAVLGMIIGFTVGGQVQILIKQLVQSFINPLTVLFFGTALSDRTFTLHFHDRVANFGWGALMYALIVFMLVIITVYWVIKTFNIDEALSKPKEK